MRPAVEARGLGKRFFISKARTGFWDALRGLGSREGRWVEAVNALTFTIAEGEFVGYIGPNGAGKSTTVKMLSGILRPSYGEVRVLGLDPRRDRIQVARSLGVVFGQKTGLWWDLPLKDSFGLLADMYRVPQAQAAKRLDEMDAVLELRGFWDVPVRRLSLGQRMRGDLAAAMLHDPPVLFLDEPTIGLDVVAKVKVRAFLRRANAQGKTIILMTHDMSDVEQLCERVVIINHGALVYDGPLSGLKARAGLPTIIRLEFAGPLNGQTPDGLRDTQVVGRNGHSLEVAFDRARQSAAAVISHYSQAGDLRDVTLSEPDIEEVIRQVYASE